MGIDEVEQWIRKNEPVDQDLLKEKFGQIGLRAARELMEKNKISYTLNWDLQTEVEQ